MAELVDHLGRPIVKSQLTREIATPSLAGVRSLWYDTVASTLTPERLAQIVIEVDQNDALNYLTLAEEMEERDLHYHSVLSTRKLAVSGLNVSVDAYSDEKRDVMIRDAVSEFVSDDAFTDLLPQQLDSLGKGYAVSEIIWDRSASKWYPEKYKWRDQRHFQFDMNDHDELRMRDEDDATNGLPLEPYKFIQHRPKIKMGVTIRSGLARLAVVAFMCKAYSIKDWMAFSDIFGMPLRVGKHAKDATKAQKAALLSAVASIGTDTACIIPEEMVIEFIDASNVAGGDKLFEGAVNFFNAEVSKGVLGQTMTSDDGSSMSQAKVHQEVRDDIKVDDAKQLSATLRRDLIKPFVDLNFGSPGRGKYPILRLITEDEEDLVQWGKSLSVFIDRGLKVQSSLVLDKFGLPEAEDGADVLHPEGETTSGNQTSDTSQGDDGDAETAREKRKTVIDLFRQIREGKVLTGDQRVLLVASLAQGEQIGDDHKDEIDRLTDEELKDWKRIMDPVLKPIQTLAQSSSSYDEFNAGLENVLAKMDSTLFAERIAVSNFKARGLGDAQDEV